MPTLDLTEAEIGDIVTALGLIGVQGAENIVRVGALISKLQPCAPKKAKGAAAESTPKQGK